MNDRSEITVGEALHEHYLAQGLPADGGLAAERWTLLAVGPAAVRLPNFRWRRRALPFHDLHHVLTGYPCTPAGEFQMAAWEFAAGRFPHALSTLFCLPLIAFGAMLTPRRSLAAFVRGRRSRTLYGAPLHDELRALQIDSLRERLLPRSEPCPTIADRIAYTGLVGLSLGLLALPAIALLVVV